MALSVHKKIKVAFLVLVSITVASTIIVVAKYLMPSNNHRQQPKITAPALTTPKPNYLSADVVARGLVPYANALAKDNNSKSRITAARCFGGKEPEYLCLVRERRPNHCKALLVTATVEGIFFMKSAILADRVCRKHGV